MANNKPSRVSKYYGGPNPKYNIDTFNKDDIGPDNIVNHFLVMKQSDISRTLVMDIFGTFDGKSMVHHYDTFKVPAGAFKFVNDSGKEVSNSTPFITTFGIWIFNILLINGFGYSFLFNGYVNENVNAKMFKKMHQTILYALMEDRITVDTYKNFIVYCDWVMPWETFLSPSQTEKLLSCTKEVNKLKNKLIKENKEALDAGDAGVAEDIEKQLIAFILEYLKDDPSLDGYLSGAGGNIGNNLKNMYLMKGAIRDPDPNAKKEFNIATSSFADGVSASEYSLLANSLIGGPYSRAKKTELGGYWEKLISYALGTVKVDGIDTDCGTDKYLEITLTKDLVEPFMYNYIIKPNGELDELTSRNIDTYVNKKVKFRSSLFCKSTTGVCHHCAGNFFYRRGSNVAGLACPQIATVLKLKSMKAFHDSTISMTEIDPMKAFGIKR